MGKKIELSDANGEIVISSGGSRTIISKEFQEEIYYIVAQRKIREILTTSKTIRSATSDQNVIEELIPFYLDRMEESNKKDSEDFCWLALVDRDLELQRQEEEDAYAYDGVEEEEDLPEGFIFDEAGLDG